MCEALRIPVLYIEDAVIDGVQKRLDIAVDPEVLRRRLTERLQRGDDAELVDRLAVELAETRKRITRLVDALAAGPEDLPSARTLLVTLEREPKVRPAAKRSPALVPHAPLR